MSKYVADGEWTAESLALYIQAVIQGGFILAKATGSAAVAAQSLDHLRRYLEQTFGRSARNASSRALRRARKKPLVSK